MNFNFHMPTKIVTGNNCITTESHLLKALGDSCLIVTSKTAGVKSGALSHLTTALEKEGIAYKVHNSVEQNPALEDAYKAGQLAKEMDAKFIVGVGGGSPLDACKAVAVYANNSLELLDIYKLDWANKALPIVVIGTTAGTGSEVTPYAIMTLPSGIKQSISHPQCFPALAYADPQYTHSLAVDFTISTGLDALSHGLEGYFNTAANSISDLFALESIKVLNTALKALKSAASPLDISSETREELYYASILAGFTIAHSGTTYCHSLGYFLSEEHQLPHGLACAIYLSGFLKRQATLLPERAKVLEESAGCTVDELISLVDYYTKDIKLAVTSEDIVAQIQRHGESNNHKKVAPSGLSPKEATEIMTDIFLKE